MVRALRDGVSIAIALVLAELLPMSTYAAQPLTTQAQNTAPITRHDEIPGALGDDLPPVGRSLFDELLASKTSATQAVPFPFSTLLRSLAKQGHCKAQPHRSNCYQAVLIPLGRSLQRTAAAPQFFTYPRVVIGFTGDASEPTTSNVPLLKDRLYLGYQEKANLIEVISYNEQAGRFEFQLVKNYGPGKTPQIFYANRVVCISCHQNQAPIFSRQVWDETNANPAIAQRLTDEHRDFYGVPIRIGVDIPNALDDATDRANILATYQSLWRDGCGDADAGRRCRARAVLAALQYRLTSEHGFDRQGTPFLDGFVQNFERNWQARWPEGLKIPNNDIPNRDPLQSADQTHLGHVPARFEALVPRGHKEIWQLDTDRFRLIKGIGEFFSRAEISALARRLDISLTQFAKTPSTTTWTSPGFRRLSHAIENLERNPRERKLFDSPTIQHSLLRDGIFRQLGIATKPASVFSVTPPRLNPIAKQAGEPQLAPFYGYCGRCHGMSEPFPPGFLRGNADEVRAQLKQCADRIYFRLSMWQLGDDQRPKTPMPPETMLPMFNEHKSHFKDGEAISVMLKLIKPWLSADVQVSPAQLIGRSYEQLRPCLTH